MSKLKITDGYIIREILDMYVVFGIGRDAYMPDRLMSLNETGKFLWDKLEEGSDAETLVDDLINEFEVERHIAEADVGAFLHDLQDKGLVREC